jgi:hypothetical protein
MKQSEKLDLILRGLYKHKDDGQWWSVKEILQSCNLPTNAEETRRLAQRLKEDNYISAPGYHLDDVFCKITTYGIEYCEESSYTYTGHSLITNNYNISIEDSHNVSVVSNSEEVRVSQSLSPAASHNLSVDKIPLSVLLHNLTIPQIWGIIASVVALIVGTFLFGYNIQQWKLEKENKTDSVHLDNTKPSITLFNDITSEMMDTIGPIETKHSPFHIYVNGQVSNAMNYYVYLIVEDNNQGWIVPGLGAHVDKYFAGECYLGKKDDIASLNKKYLVYAVVTNREYTPYTIFDRKTIIEQSNVIPLFRTH